MVQIWLFRLAASLAFLAFARIVFLCVLRRPVTGRTRASELGEMERAYDSDIYQMHRMDGHACAGDNPFKPVLTRVQYKVRGVAYTADVTLLTTKGERPESLPTLWYDPRDPRRVTGIGPVWAVLLLIVSGWIAFFAREVPF